MEHGGDLMDGALEDGELSGSCSDPDPDPVRVPGPLRDRARAQASSSGYRCGSRPGGCSDSDSSGGEEEEEEEEEEEASWRRKRQRVSSRPTSGAATSGAPPRRVNNIWGSVVQEQRQDAVATELGILGMEGGVSMASRDVETYNYVLARKMMDRERDRDRDGDGDGDEVGVLDRQLEEYMKGGDAKRKRPAKERLGPRAEMDVKGRYEITEDDPEDAVVDEIAYRLQEPKKDLIERVVRVLGAKKAIELLGETATLEERGGVYTLDGSRRRTPGGVYLNLLKNTPSIGKAQVRKIFLDEQHREQKNKKAAQKRKRHLLAKKMKEAIGTLNLQEHDDVSRETFASDTNDALESLEEDADDGRAAAAVGLDDTAVVYNGADLEVF